MIEGEQYTERVGINAKCSKSADNNLGLDFESL